MSASREPPVGASSPSSPTRRSFLAGAALAGVGAAGAPRTIQPAGPKRVLRLAHPTDIHVQPELRGGEGMRACFAHMMALETPPGLIITGGDLPMDTASTPEAKSRIEWELFRTVISETVSSGVPVYHTIGNHDIFGRDKVKCQATGREKGFGKAWFLEMFGYERTYRSFDMAGWHFIILDSIDLLPDGDEFVCRITGEQLDWLRADLRATPGTTPTVVVTHAPIMSIANFFDKDDDEWAAISGDLQVSAKRMHVDCRELEGMFRTHGGVKLCLSGHLHLLDRCRYNGITYICDGAVCGAKWKGQKRQTGEGYGVIDLYADGTFEHSYQSYGWQAAGKG